jgi:methenyltetrahydrofolate cyclohydrolase
MKYCDLSLKRYLDDVAAKLPAPGGGSAAALGASLASSLVSMVIHFTLGKPRYAQYENELKETLEKSLKLKDEFLRLVDLDVVAYKSKNMRDSLNVPFMCCRLCYEGMRLCPGLIKKGNIHLVSDVAAAAILFEAAFAASYCNVEINLQSLRDKALTVALRKELNKKSKVIKRMRQTIEAKTFALVTAEKPKE